MEKLWSSLKEKERNTLQLVISWNNFDTIVMKWKKVSIIMMNTSCSQHLKNCPMCKDKWGSIYGDLFFKLIT